MKERAAWVPEVAPGRYGLFWIAIWTVFLLEPLGHALDESNPVRSAAGVTSIVAFVAWYLGVFAYQRRDAHRMFAGQAARAGIVTVAVADLLAVVACVLIDQSADATAVYVCVLCVMTLPRPWSLATAALHAAAWFLAGYAMPGWRPDSGLLLSMGAASVAVFGIREMISGNVRLRLATNDNERLAVADERNRFARDLHDILGHSLTVIRVKAELAGRLVEVDPTKARAELDDLERLARDALGDVRRAVEGYRELTLPGELTRARAALRAAEIEADLPNSTDEVPGDLRELFAWTVREGVTNVVRHSGARHCTVLLSATSAEVRDDGRGLEGAGSGNGLLGLRERAASHGATVVCRPGEPRGHSLLVAVP